MRSSRLHPGMVAALMLGIAGYPGMLAPAERLSRPPDVKADKLTKAQAKRERRAARNAKSRNGA
jgi:hypothetical protein